MQLQGKDYLQVAHRILWMREDHPDWVISTSFVNLGTPPAEQVVVACCEILDGSGKILGRGHGASVPKSGSFEDVFERAETAAIGRTLGHLGYGTQFAQELDEPSDKVVDSPFEAKSIPKAPSAPKAPEKAKSEPPPQAGPAVKKLVNHAPGAKDTASLPIERRDDIRERANELKSYVIKVGKKYLNQELGQVPESDAVSFRDWLLGQAKKDGKPLIGHAKEFVEAVEELYDLPIIPF